MIKSWAHAVLGVAITLQVMARSDHRQDRDERGLSQSTENAILLAGAVTIALALIGFIGKYVADHMPGK